VISLKLSDALDAQLSEQAQRSRLSKSELVADLVGCCEGAPADLSANPAYLAGFGTPQ
jgi:hypothetical protein